MEMELVEPTDRNFRTNGALGGNIDNNAGTNFEVVAIDGNRIYSLYYFLYKTWSAKSGPSDTFWRFMGPHANAPILSDKPVSILANTNYKLKTDLNGFIGLYNSNGLVTNILAIRPLEANIKPGDDLILRAQVKLNGAISSDHAPSYLAVYDKKMLWRANLYIDEGAQDWNTLNPWNASPTGTGGQIGSLAYSNGTNVNWYGRNEWNRSYDGVNFGPSDGGQVVNYENFSWTPVRIRTGDTPNWNDRVSYDYEHGTIRAWDSPFDFLYKQRKQRLALTGNFNAIPQPQAIGVFPTGVGAANIPLPPQN